MAIYHFNIRTESHISHTITVKREDHEAVRIELARFVAELLSSHADQIWIDKNWQIDVSDESGLILYAMHIDASKKAASITTEDNGLPVT